MLFREWLEQQDEEIEFDLMHAEAEHEMATICGNPLKEEEDLIGLGYNDILAATVIEVVDSDMITVYIANAKPSRVEEFQFYLAGY